MKRLDVARFLPAPMRAAVITWRFYAGGLLLWAVFAAGLIALDSGVINLHGDFTAIVSVSGADSFEVGRATGHDDAWELSVGGHTRLITVAGNQASVPEGNGAAWTLSGDDDSELVASNPAHLGYRFKLREDDGYSVRGADGGVLWRVKFKDGKFNIYDGADHRSFHGKAKNGVVRVLDEANRERGSVSGGNLADGAMLALPIPVEVRALGWLFQHRGQWSP